MGAFEKRVVDKSDLSNNQMKKVTVGDKDVIIAKSSGQFCAVGAKCPHYGGPLNEGTLYNGRLRCPWHHSVFNICTGELIEPPALDEIPVYPVRVDGDGVYVSIPEQATEKEEPAMSPANLATDSRTFAVIGGGAAGAAAVEALRHEGFAGRLLLISADPHRPYDRPNCSKDYLAGTAPEEYLPLRSEEFYRQHAIEIAARRVTRFDVPSREITFDDGTSLRADAVLLASGSCARKLNVPGADLKNVFTLRTWDDCNAIIQAAGPATRAVVIGASFIAMETAASLKQRGVACTVIAPESVPFARVFGVEIGKRLMQMHEQNGTAFKLQTGVKQFRGNSASGAVEAVELTDGSVLPADLVIVGVGVNLQTDFIQGVPRNTDGSLDTDEFLRVADGVYAAGDIARYPEPYSGERARIEHWRLAEQHGRAAAKSMLGRGEPFRGVPFFWTTQFGTSISYVGHARVWDEIIFTGDLGKLDFVAYLVQGDRALAAIGTQSTPLCVFAELLHSGQIPAPAELRCQPLALPASPLVLTP